MGQDFWDIYSFRPRNKNLIDLRTLLTILYVWWIKIMVLTLDDTSERGAHVRSNLCNLICTRHFLRSSAFFRTSKKFFYLFTPLLVTGPLKKNAASLRVWGSIYTLYYPKWNLYFNQLCHGAGTIVYISRPWAPNRNQNAKNLNLKKPQSKH